MPKATVAEVLAFLPADGSKMDYADFEQKVVTSNLDSPREALREIITQKLANLLVSAELDASGHYAGKTSLKVWRK